MIPAYVQQWLYTQLEQLGYADVRQCFVDVSRVLDDAAWLKPKADVLALTGSQLVTLQGALGPHRVEIWLARGYPSEASHVIVDAQPRPVPPHAPLSELLQVATRPLEPPAKPASPAAAPSKPPKLPAKPAVPAKPSALGSAPQLKPGVLTKADAPAGFNASGPVVPGRGVATPGWPARPDAAAESVTAEPGAATRPVAPARPPKSGDNGVRPPLSSPPLPPKAPAALSPFRPSSASLDSTRRANPDSPASTALHYTRSETHSIFPPRPTQYAAMPTPDSPHPQPPFSIGQSATPTNHNSPAPVHAAPPAPASAASSILPRQPKAPPIDLLDLTDAPEPSISKEKAEALAKLQDLLNARAAELYYQSQLDAQQLASASHALDQVESALAQEESALLRAKEIRLRNIDVLKQSARAAQDLSRRAAEHSPPQSASDLVAVAASDRALLEADSGNRAIDDLLRLLPKALDAGSISLHVYLRLVRQYAREQFAYRHALLQRRPLPPKPPAKK